MEFLTRIGTGIRRARRLLVIAASAALVVAGIWGLWGWQWAAIAAGLPAVAFYLYGEVRAVRLGLVQTLEDQS